jgi:23S rRNA (uracil1939-C5)-methyltransferase
MKVTISGLNANGHGIAEADGRRIAIPLTLPGESVELGDVSVLDGGKKPRFAAQEILAPSADRVVAPCVHFGSCGGCSLQHLAAEPALAWKTQRVLDALRRAGFTTAPLKESLAVAPGLRRRLDFSLRRYGTDLVFGLCAQGSQDVVAIDTCPALLPGLSALLKPLQKFLRSISAFRKIGGVAINFLDDGADILLRADGPLSLDDRKNIAAFAEREKILRISLDHGFGETPETIAARAPCRVRFGNNSVDVPPGAFLQASVEGENAIIAALLDAMPGKKNRPRVTELFAGLGTLSFRLGEIARVHAYEGHAESSAACKRARGSFSVEAICRDLMRQPLQPREFAAADIAVLDPPWDGAGAQMAPLAAAGVPHIIYVSCNPEALARDTAMLAEKNYACAGVTVIDQFPWTGEVESVVSFRGAKRPPNRDRR